MRSVERGSAAEQAGVRAGDVITMIDDGPVEDTRDLLARTASTAPGTRVTVQTFRNGEVHTLVATIEAQPGDSGDAVPHNDAERDDGLTLGEITTSDHGVTTGTAAGGVLVVDVNRDSPADEAELEGGDVIRMINGRPVKTVADARRALGAVTDRRPIYLLVERRKTELFLEMRRD